MLYSEINFIIHKINNTDEALDFMLGASNLTEDIAVFFIQQGVTVINQFKALKGFEIHNIYAEKESLEKHQIDLKQCALNPKILPHQAIKNHIAQCQRVFAF